MKTELHKEHHWLQKFVGEWTYQSEVSMGPDQPPEQATGIEHVRSLDGLWILAEGQGEMPGCGPATTMLTLGYDPEKQHFIGTWVGSMMTYLWVYEGELDASEKVLSLSTEGPDMSGGSQLAKYRDVVEFKSDDHRVLTSHYLGDDGQWHAFMTANYRRKQ
ncbi:MAG: DUF1579 domain-containing protein [Cyanobacteria bacterium Co-bin13]|nr:DUF1579 domain-containing protein [Cyanobacteria bacterium Co-bin13]